jgi:hypothetical protein
MLPDKIMITLHPQLWTKELVWQNVKNEGKLLIIKSRRIRDRATGEIDDWKKR